MLFPRRILLSWVLVLFVFDFGFLGLDHRAAAEDCLLPKLTALHGGLQAELARERLLEVLTPTQKEGFLRIIRIGKSRSYDQAPLTRHVMEAIRTDSKIDFQDDIFVMGWSQKLGDMLIVTLDFGESRNPADFPRVFYGIIEGIAARTAADPSIRSFRINAGEVINPKLVETYRSLGFTIKESRGSASAEGAYVYLDAVKTPDYAAAKAATVYRSSRNGMARERLLSGLAPAQRAAFSRLLELGKARGYAEAPLTQHLTEAIAKDSKIAFEDESLFIGWSQKVGDMVIVSLDFGGKLGPADFERGLYAVFEGLAARAAQDPKLKHFRIDAGEVIHPELLEICRSLGFTLKKGPGGSGSRGPYMYLDFTGGKAMP